MPNSLTIRFVSGKGYDSRLIEWYSDNDWSHVEIIHDGVTFGAQLNGGLGWRLADADCYKNARKFETWAIPITEEQEKMLTKLIIDAENASYDWLAILSFALGPKLRLHLKGRWICSGWIAGVLKSLNLAYIEYPLESYEPAHIRLIVTQLSGARRVE